MCNNALFCNAIFYNTCNTKFLVRTFAINLVVLNPAIASKFLGSDTRLFNLMKSRVKIGCAGVPVNNASRDRQANSSFVYCERLFESIDHFSKSFSHRIAFCGSDQNELVAIKSNCKVSLARIFRNAFRRLFQQLICIISTEMSIVNLEMVKIQKRNRKRLNVRIAFPRSD